MMTQASFSRRSALDTALLAAIWGASFLSIRLALDEVSVLSSVVHRVGWAAVLLWALVLLYRLDIPRSPRVWISFLVMGLLNNVIPFSLMAWGQLHIETGLVSILNATTAVFGVLAAALFFADERLTWRRMIGVSLGFAGVVAIIGTDALSSIDIRSLAQLAVLAGTVSYALAGVWARKHLVGQAPQVAAAGMLTGSTLILVPVTLWAEGGVDVPQTWRGTGAIGYYAGIATAGAYLLYYRILAVSGTGNLLLVTLLIPPVAVFLGALVLDERLGPNAFIGLALIAAGLTLMTLRRDREANKRPN